MAATSGARAGRGRGDVRGGERKGEREERAAWCPGATPGGLSRHQEAGGGEQEVASGSPGSSTQVLL
jgi:hypothetical protein